MLRFVILLISTVACLAVVFMHASRDNDKTAPPKNPLPSVRRVFPASVSSPPVRPNTTPHTDTTAPESCQACHELDASTPPNVTQLRSATACFACHPATDFAVTHGHTLEPLQDCEMCHSLHGSTVPAKGLLAAPAAVQCNACHDGDH